MTSSSAAGQLQFRNMQPPSKVIHLRNLPWECSEEELVELCKPFGKVVNTKLNVGANRNQAFVEFGDMNQAMSMISYYASSSEPAQIRGRTVYLQYSNRQEIINSKSSADTASNVLLVTIEGVEAGDVSIDVLHLVFSAFGFVHKIATFEKTAGFQALVQFSDPATASSARTALDGRSIPRYLLPEHVSACHLHITFSAHNDLTVKFQSHRSRDYTNPYLPVAPSAINSVGQSVVGADGKVKEPESNVLLASIENMQYAVTIDVLHMVFSTFGTIQKIVMFEKEGFQALIQYADIPTAVLAKEALEGHCIYDGGYCKLHLSYSRHTDLNVKVNNDRGRDYTNPNPGVKSAPSLLGQPPSMQATVPMVVGVASPASIVQSSNQFIGLPQQRADAVAAAPQMQGHWGFVTPQLLSSQQGMTTVAAASSIIGSAPFGVSSLPSTGRAALGTMFSQQAGMSYAAPSGYGPIPVAFSPLADGQAGIGMLSAASGSIPHVGHSSGTQPLVLINQPQAFRFPAPGGSQMGMSSPASGLSSF